MTKKHQIAVFIILGLATFTRFWHFGEIQFSHDELSALLRTGYPNFSTLLEKGIKVDGHPAGVQTFLHYYTQWVGYQEWVVKLPFALAGIGTVALIIACGWALQKPQAGLLAGGCAAVMQHFVMYGQVIRPYGLGLFFVTLAAYFWIRFFYQTNRWPTLWGFMLAAAAAAYTHHFALLLIGLMALSGFAFLPLKKWPIYLLFNAGILVLYLPHWSVFFNQLAIGGIESWLAPPQPNFLLQYFQYVAHYSWWFGAALVLSVLGIWGKPKAPLFWPGLLWFGLSFLIIYVYSTQVSAVLQFSGLVFGFPFLLLFLFSGGAGARWPWAWALLLILSLGSLSLYLQRQHYPYFYYSPFAKPLQEWQAKGPNALLLHHLDEQKLHFYAQHLNCDTSRIERIKPERLARQVDSLLALHSAPQIILALDESAPREIPHFFSERAGVAYQQKNFFNFSLYTFEEKQQAPKILWERKSKGLKAIAAEAEFGAPYQWVFQLPKNLGPEDYFLAHFTVESDHLFTHTEIASAIYQDDSLVNWETSPLSDFQSSGSFAAYHAFLVKPFSFKEEEVTLKLFLYNHDRLPFKVQLQSLKILRGNPKVYGKFYPF